MLNLSPLTKHTIVRNLVTMKIIILLVSKQNIDGSAV
jgi:hypothetical protein